MLRSQPELVCQEVVEMITDYLEDALPRSQRRRLEAHLSRCDGCHEYLQQIQATIQLTGRLAREDLTPQMRHEFTTLYRRWTSERHQP